MGVAQGLSLALAGVPGQARLNVEAMLQGVNYPNTVQRWKEVEKKEESG
jgi:hypothetical protein